MGLTGHLDAERQPAEYGAPETGNKMCRRRTAALPMSTPETQQPSAPILITGATGLVGSALAEALVAQGETVRALVRPTSKTAPLHNIGVELFIGDVTHRETLDAPMEDVDTVFHCAAFVGDWGPAERFRRVNMGGTTHVVAAAAHAGVRRMVHLSSIAVYGKDPSPEMAEWLPFGPCGDPYYDSKIDAEQAAFAAAGTMEVTAIRPGVIYGPADKLFLPRLIRAMKYLPVPRLFATDGMANFVYVQNVVAQCLRQAEDARAAGHAFNAIDAEPMRLNNVLRLIATKTGGRRPRGVVLPEAAQFAATALETVWRTFALPGGPPLNRFIVDGARLERPYSMEKARWLLDFVPPYTMRDGLLETLAELTGNSLVPSGGADWGYDWEEQAEDGDAEVDGGEDESEDSSEGSSEDSFEDTSDDASDDSSDDSSDTSAD